MVHTALVSVYRESCALVFLVSCSSHISLPLSDDLPQLHHERGVGVAGESESESGGGAHWNQSKVQARAVHTHLWTL